MSRYAIVQKPPVFLDKRKSIASAVALVDDFHESRMRE